MARQRYGSGTCTPRRYKGQVVPNQFRLRVNLAAGPDGKRREYVEIHKGTKTSAHERLAKLVADRADLVPARERKPVPAVIKEWISTGAPIERPVYDLDQSKLAYFSNSGGYGKSVNKLLDDWLAHIAKRGRSASYVTQARQKSKLHIRPVLGTVSLDRLDARRLDAFYDSLLAKGLQPSSVRQLHAFLSSALNQAVKWGWIDRAPTERATPPTVRAPDLPVPSPEDVRSLVEAADPLMTRAIALAALTGARRGELCAIRWSDVDAEAGVMRIAKAVTGKATIGPTKTHQVRVLALDPVAVALLGEPGLPDVFVLTGTDRPASPNVLTQGFRGLADSLGMPYRFHDLRHYSATQLVAAGVDMRTVTNRLGWGSLQMVNRYASAVPQTDRAAAGVLGRTLSNAG